MHKTRTKSALLAGGLSALAATIAVTLPAPTPVAAAENPMRLAQAARNPCGPSNPCAPMQRGQPAANPCGPSSAGPSAASPCGPASGQAKPAASPCGPAGQSPCAPASGRSRGAPNPCGPANPCGPSRS